LREEFIMTAGFDDDFGEGFDNDFESGFTSGPDEPSPGGGNNRLFVIIAIGLVGLLVLGLMGIGSVVALNRIRQAQQVAAATATPTTAVVLQPSPSPTLTPVQATATNTPAPTATNTPVVGPGNGGGGEAGATATRTPVPIATPVGDGQVPDTGIGGFGAALIASGLAGVLFLTRRLRKSN
jgi:hypothetical protein